MPEIIDHALVEKYADHFWLSCGVLANQIPDQEKLGTVTREFLERLLATAMSEAASLAVQRVLGTPPTGEHHGPEGGHQHPDPGLPWDGDQPR